MKFLQSLLVVCLLCALGANSAFAQYTGPKLKFRVAHPCPPGHHTTLAFEKFGELVAEKSGGKIRVLLFPNAILGSDRSMIESAQKGELEMAVSSTPNMANFSSAFMVFDLPYITSAKHQKNLYTAIDHGELGRYFQKVFHGIGLEPIMYCEYGYRDLMSVNRPLRSIDDLAGMKVRTTSSPVEVEVAKALGMKPSPIAWGETYTALEQGTVDSEGNTFSFLYGAGHHTILKYGMTSNHNYCMQIMSANRAWWERLNPQARQIIREAAAEALAYQRTVLAPQSEERSRRQMEEAGVLVVDLTEAQLNALREKTRPVWDMYTGVLSQELIDLVAATQY